MEALADTDTNMTSYHREGSKSEYTCDRCGIKFLRYTSEMNRKNRPKAKKAFCSRKCMAKGYMIDRDGYILIYAKDHPKCNARGFVREHRMEVEKHLGRHLEIEEVVHHKDRDKANNHIDNLEIMTKSDHHRLHSTKEKP